MKRAKKRPPEGWHLRAVASWACAENHLQDYYTKFSGKCKPIFGGPARPAAWGEEEGRERAESSPEAGTEQSGISSDEDGGGGALPMSWAMLLTYIGAAGLVSQLARLIDWIEGG